MVTPYFLWDFNLTERQIQKVLHGSNEIEKRWLAARILTHAKFEDIWKYLTISEILRLFPTLKLPENTKKAWQRALNTWGYNV